MTSTRKGGFHNMPRSRPFSFACAITLTRPKSRYSAAVLPQHSRGQFKLPAVSGGSGEVLHARIRGGPSRK